MKNKAIIIVSILAVITLVAGIVLFSVGMTKLNWDFDQLNYSKYEMKNYNSLVEDSISMINIDVDNAEIKLVESQDGSINIDYLDNEKRPISIEFLNNQLIINQEHNTGSFNWFFNFGFKKQSIIISYPHNSNIILDIDTSNSNFKLNDTTFQSMDINTSNGKIELINVNASIAKLESRNAECIISNSNIGNISVETSNARITLTEVLSDIVSVETSNSKIVIDRINASDIKLKSSNGSIIGTIIGNIDDYQITANTSNASSNLGNKLTGSKSLTVKTSNAEIKINFVN